MVLAAAAARPQDADSLPAVEVKLQEADSPPAVEGKPKELAGDGTSHQQVPTDSTSNQQVLTEGTSNQQVPTKGTSQQQVSTEGTSQQPVPANGAGDEQQLEERARALLKMLEPLSEQQKQNQTLKEWTYASNITTENEKAMVGRAGRSGADLTGTSLSMLSNDVCLPLLEG